MDPLERAAQVLARAAQVASAASQILPARAKLTQDVHAVSGAVAALKATLQAQGAQCRAAQQDEAEATASAAVARARLVQLMRQSAELLGAVSPSFAGVGSVPGLGEEPACPVDDPTLPHRLRDALQRQGGALAGRASSTHSLAGRARGGSRAVGALGVARPDLLEAAQAGLERDDHLLGEGYSVLQRALEAWVREELQLSARVRQVST